MVAAKREEAARRMNWEVEALAAWLATRRCAASRLALGTSQGRGAGAASSVIAK
jgi:hypothetical protein